MPRKYISKLSREERSAIARAAGIRSGQVRREAAWPEKLPSEHIPLHRVGMTTEDYILLHRYAVATKRSKVSILHELAAPLPGMLARLNERTDEDNR